MVFFSVVFFFSPDFGSEAIEAFSQEVTQTVLFFLCHITGFFCPYFFNLFLSHSRRQKGIFTVDNNTNLLQQVVLNLLIPK